MLFTCPFHVCFPLKLGLRKCTDLFDFGLHCSLMVSLILLYFLSTKPSYKKLYQKFYGCNAELFLEGQ